MTPRKYPILHAVAVRAALLLVLLLPETAGAQTDVAAAASPPLRRWVDLQNATLNFRYRFVDTSAGVTSTSQVQHRETLRAALKLDSAALYTIQLGVFTGTRFTSGWNHTPLGISDAQRGHTLKALFASARPWRGLEAQAGGLYIVRGESTEITTYDEDGYVMGGRLTLRRPEELWLDEVSLTDAHFTSDPELISVWKRFSHIGESSYRQLLIRKSLGGRAAVSVDFTAESGRHTWRQAVNVRALELKVVDAVLFEQYQRTNSDAAYGFALSLAKQLTPKLSLSQFGYARIDPGFHPLNADRFNIGNRAYATVTYVFSPSVTASYFVTRAVGDNVPLSQRTLMNAAVTFSLLPALRRTGIF